MKIIIDPADGHRMVIPLPTRFIFSGLAGRYIGKWIRLERSEEGEEAPALPADLIPTAGRDLLQMRKDYPGLPLVEVESSDGDHVVIFP
ncbi:MAG: hypothetical protein PT957_00485 [Firmicutes bacterium]|nr:hypothetical protein [Bacillota bacterium]